MGGNPEFAQRKPQSARTIAVGVVALILGGLCTLGSFVVGVSTYTNSRARDSAVHVSIVAALIAFLSLWCAWRLLGRGGRIRAAVIAAVNLIQLLIILLTHR